MGTAPLVPWLRAGFPIEAYLSVLTAEVVLLLMLHVEYLIDQLVYLKLVLFSVCTEFFLDIKICVASIVQHAFGINFLGDFLKKLFPFGSE